VLCQAAALLVQLKLELDVDVVAQITNTFGAPEHMGALLVTIGVDGTESTTTLVHATPGEAQPFR